MTTTANNSAPLERAMRVPLSILDALATFALAVMLILTTLEVVMRALFGMSLEITEELSSYALVALLFCGAPRVMLTDGFLKVDIIYGKLKGRAKYAVDAIYSLLALGITAVYIYQVYRLIESSLRRGSRSTTLLETPLYIPQIVILIGLVGVAMALVALLAANIGRLGGNAGESEGDGR